MFPCTGAIMGAGAKFIPLVVPYVWSDGGPVEEDVVLPDLLVQSKSSLLSCTYPQIFASSKSQTAPPGGT